MFVLLVLDGGPIGIGKDAVAVIRHALLCSLDIFGVGLLAEVVLRVQFDVGGFDDAAIEHQQIDGVHVALQQACLDVGTCRWDRGCRDQSGRGANDG